MIPTPAVAAASAVGGTAIKALSGNLKDFLGLLMTQLRNQDPSSPLDTNQFTSQLVQFASVEQQVSANTNLTKLIELTQSNAVLQSSALVGKPVEIASDRLALQDGRAGVRFDSREAGAVRVSVLNDAGKVLREADVPTTAGRNDWSWDGRDGSGNRMPDGAYRIAVTAVGAGDTAQAVPFTVLGTVTGTERSSNGMSLQLGALTVDMGTVRSVAR